MNGTYRPITRIDIAVNGDASDSFAYYENNDWIDLTTEDYRVPYSEIGHGPHDLTMENYSWLVKDSGNTGFYIEQDIGQFPQEPPSQGASPFLYVTLHHPDEGDEDIPIVGECCNDNHIQGPEQFVDGENIQNQNIVIWYVPQFEAEIMSPPYYCWAEPDGPNEGIYPCFAGPMFHPFPTDSLIYLPIVKNND
jgi:hypothetical protein